MRRRTFLALVAVSGLPTVAATKPRKPYPSRRLYPSLSLYPGS